MESAANAVVSAVPYPALCNFYYHEMLSSKQSTIKIPKPEPMAPAANIEGSVA